MYYLSLAIAVAVLLSGCSSKEKVVAAPDTDRQRTCQVKEGNDTFTFDLADLERFPQNAKPYAQNIRERQGLVSLQKAYERHYFRPWSISSPPESKEAAMWPFTTFTEAGSFGENLQPLPKSWFDEMRENANFDAYGAVSRPAITLRYLNLRNFPTQKPLFRDPSIAGEGFPFDYLQNSGIHANEPVFVSHYSKDGGWVYLFSSYATGWVPSHTIAYMKAEYIEQWKHAKQLHIIADNYPIRDEAGRFTYYARVGMMLPLITIEPSRYIALAVTAGAHNEPTYTRVVVPRFVGREEPLPLDRNNLPDLANELMQGNYGWGGLYGDRDCSSTLRDYYAPFGIWLPRNSFQQSRIGKKIDMRGMSREEKIATIVSQGIPFETLLYREGHILLYLGVYDDQIMVMHNVWGVRTKEEAIEGRKIVGKTIISTLDLGCEQENYDEAHNILAKLLSMNIITASEPDR